MAGVAAAAAIVGGAVLIGGVMGSKSMDKASARASAEAAAARGDANALNAIALEERREAAAKLEQVGIPPIEAMRITLESPELVGLEVFRELAPSAFQDIKTDPLYKEAQDKALGDVQEYAEKGRTEQQKFEELESQRRAGAEFSAQQKLIREKFAERGIGGSGIELAAALQSQSSVANRRAMEQQAIQAAAENRALQATLQGGQLAGQIRGQEFGEEAQTAQAADIISRFNVAQQTAVEGRNLEREQAIASEEAAKRNQQELYNKGLIQQDYLNRMGKEQAVAAAKTGTAQQLTQQSGQVLAAGQAAAQGQIQAGAAKAQLYGNLAGSVAGAAGASMARADDGGVIKQKAAYGAIIDDEGRYAYGGIAGNGEDSYYDGEDERMKKRKKLLGYQAGGTVLPPPNAVQSTPHPNSNGGYAGGGVPIPDDGSDEETRYLAGDVIPGDDYAGDRVDAKVNSGEMVLNLEQQQRLMDLLKGYRDLEGLGDENIIDDKHEVIDPAMISAGEQEGDEFAVPMSQIEAISAQNGAVVPSRYYGDKDKYASRKAYDKAPKPRGVHASLNHEKAEEEKSNQDNKYRKARIKAYETLINGGR